jgi:hypothetical protein
LEITLLKIKLVQMRSLGRTLLQYDWHPYKKQKLGDRLINKESASEEHEDV